MDILIGFIFIALFWIAVIGLVIFLFSIHWSIGLLALLILLAKIF